MTTTGVAGLIAVISHDVRWVLAILVNLVGFLVSVRKASGDERVRLYKILARTSNGIAAVTPLSLLRRKPPDQKEPEAGDERDE